MRMIDFLCVVILGGGTVLFAPENCAAQSDGSMVGGRTADIGATAPRSRAGVPNIRVSPNDGSMIGGRTGRIPKTRTVTVKPSPAHMNMVTIQPGIGLLGSPGTETKRQRVEGPETEISINYAFEVGKFEVTFDDWEACVSGGGCRGHRPNDKGWGRGKRPVINISYDDTQSYLRWLNRKTGRKYRLLSEAEWEYIARAGQRVPFGTGFGITAKMANFNGSAPYNADETGPYFRKTQPVGQYDANPFGLHDVHGNVYEWVEDCWNPSHKNSTRDGKPRKDGDCDYRVMKGGSWVTHGYQMRAASRVRYVTDYRYDDYGFRLARTLE